jgi:predicted nucleic acid-binding protein
MAFSLLTELELKNAIWRAVGDKRISEPLASGSLGDLDRDLIDGFLQRCGIDSVAHYRKALQLSEQYAPKHLTRALDILQVAAALLLKTAEFVSFDLRQRRLASDVGLKLLPVRLNP